MLVSPIAASEHPDDSFFQSWKCKPNSCRSVGTFRIFGGILAPAERWRYTRNHFTSSIQIPQGFGLRTANFYHGPMMTGSA